MASLNRVILIGNLTRDPELRYTAGGVPVCTLRLAVNRNFKNQQGETETDFFNVSAWRQRAELCAEYLSKGRPVAVEGRLQSRSWETEDGQKRSAVDIVADNIVFLGRRERGDDLAEMGISNLMSGETPDLEPSDSDGGDDIVF
ncbi:MAG: single-stranded DNA-binding protein [Candidatus Geothermincolia bacterium]